MAPTRRPVASVVLDARRRRTVPVRASVRKNYLRSPEYAAFVNELKARVQSARMTAARAVNAELVLLYWDIGRAIVEKQRAFGWGESVVEDLSRDLRRVYPEMRGFSARNLWYMRRFFTECSEPAILQQAVAELQRTRPRRGFPPAAQELAGLSKLQQLVAEIPWGHHVVMLDKVSAPAARLYYLRAAARFGWSRHILLNQIKACAYEHSRQEGKSHNFPCALPAHLAQQAEEAIKSTYNLEFLGIHRKVKERELEDRLVERLRDFILELGYGFCFIGRQHRLSLGRKEYSVDLLFYHRFLKSLVAFDLKVREFEPEFTGKMDFYLNLLNERERAPDDRPSIGIILCAEKDNLEVEYALKSKGNPIGVASYELQPSLPSSFKGLLPTTRQLTDIIRPMLPPLARK